MIFTAPLVGAHFRPPAKSLLSVLPNGTDLTLRLEPDNAYDANAIAVDVTSAAIPPAEHVRQLLADDALRYGYSLEDILAQTTWQLGYVKATEAARLAPRLRERAGLVGTDPEESWQIKDGIFPAKLSFAPEGKPQVSIEVS